MQAIRYVSINGRIAFSGMDGVEFVRATYYDRLITMLADCYRLTGADPDGNEDWRLAEDAVAAVAELRRAADQ